MLSPEYITIGSFAIVVIILLVWTIRLEIKLKHVLRGKNAKSLEDTIQNLGKEVSELKSWKKDSLEYLKSVESRLSKSVRGVETVRFNAFKGDGTGGNQSFALALLNEKGDGAVISSIYSRDRTSVFAKPIKKNSSEYELSEEERRAIGQSAKSIESL